MSGATAQGRAGRLWAGLRAQVAALKAWARANRTDAALLVLLAALALGTRLWDVGGRTLHYDEILHAWYAWIFSEGGGYAHTPLTHGPFLFHAAAATYWLIGASDVAARLLPALFGAALVPMPYLLRNELGRVGAFAASGLLLISPTMLYFGRFVRNDVYMAVWALAIVILVYRYAERPRPWMLFAWAALWAFAFTTKETTYFLAGIVGLALFTMSWRGFWAWAKGERKLSALPPAGTLLLVLATLSMPLFAPAAGLAQDWAGIVLINPDVNHPGVMDGSVARADAETGAPVGGALYIAVFLVAMLAALAVTLGLLWDRRRWPWLAGAFGGVWLVLYTSVFTNWQGFFTGLWGSLGYWMAQQPVGRAGQPWYYYFLGLSTYEFLIAALAFTGGVYLLFRGKPSDRFILFWAAATLGAGIYAGEKMPWLLMGITLPLAIIAGRAVGLLAGAARRLPSPTADSGGSPSERLVRRLTSGATRAVWAGVGGLAVVSMGGYAVVRVARDEAFVSSERFWVPFVLALLGALILALAARKEWRKPALAAAALGAVVCLTGMTVLVSARAAYSYAGYERPAELLVYSQTGQETTYAAECIAKLAERSGLGHGGLRVLSGESDNFAWQWRWYLRDYPNVTYRSLAAAPLTEPPEVDVVLASRGVASAASPFLAGFTEVGSLSHLWWFPNASYRDLTLGGMALGITQREGWRVTADYFFARGFDRAMYRSQGAVYVADGLAHMAQACTRLRAASGG
ncbi:MAG: TIGR03663 family protein [Dehalococcoidia bacterium]|nr:TIGR03663 family protein [Dehalococcoidia bacterium]